MSRTDFKAPSRSSAVVNSFTQDGRHYEARLNDCGKANCTRCGGEGKRHPSHGPYWYLCVQRNGRWHRIYLGKELDTRRYVLPNGEVDWPEVLRSRAKHRRRRRRSEEARQSATAGGDPECAPLELRASPDCPGQSDLVDDLNADPAAASPGAESPKPDPLGADSPQTPPDNPGPASNGL